MDRVLGKVAFVSGGATGIGAAICRMLAREGASVVVADILEQPGLAVADEIIEAGGRAFFQRLDVRLEADWVAATERTLETFGGLHVLVNNAAVGVPFGDAEKQSLEDWQTVMAVNGDGVFLGQRQAIRIMRRIGAAGSIINLSSTAAITGVTVSCAYTASKGAVRSLTKSAAIYCARERLPIRIDSLHPGYVETEMFRETMDRDGQFEGAIAREFIAKIPMGRFGEPDDIANGVLFLASDESRYMTGAELVIDGGYIAQ